MACKKETTWQTEGTITRPDYGMCPRCGGWFIEIGDATYRFYKLPKLSGVDLEKESLPLNVILTFRKDKDESSINTVHIKRIRKK